VIRKIISQGFVLPRFYGIAYMLDWQAKAVCYPIPINRIVGIWYIFSVWLRSPTKGQREKERKRAFLEGHNRGFKEGYKLAKARLNWAGDDSKKAIRKDG